MSFNSLHYFIFLPVVYLVFAGVGDRFRWLVLLFASLFFYGFLLEPHLIIALLGVALVSYAGGILMGATSDARRRYLLFLGTIGCDLLVLVILKYLPFLTNNLNSFFNLFGHGSLLPSAPVLVSIGVSFFVFQAISYLIDVYLEVEEPERHLGYFTLSLAFFPKLLQGPIERAGDLLPQLRVPYRFDYDNMRSGLLLFGWGLFKKIVIADRLGLFVDAVYGNVHSFTGMPLILATWLYAFQLYFDFSGYTDMALGAACLFNIRLTQNFNGPYLATSVADFWRRWHISFSRWILDYVFKPLQFSMRDWGNRGIAAALLVTFVVSGIWHGASWGFIVWGALHGIFMGVSVLLRPWQKKVHKALGVEKTTMLKVWQIGVTFNLVCFSWIFFRATTLSDAAYIISNQFAWSSPAAMGIATGEWVKHNLFLDQSWREVMVAVAGLSVCTVVAVVKNKWSTDVTRFLGSQSLMARWALYYALLFALIVFSVNEKGTFIYYKF